MNCKNFYRVLARPCLVLGAMLGALAPAAAQAPTAPTLGKMALAVVLPETDDVLDAGQRSRLEGRLTQMVTRGGLSASGYGTNFALYPVVTVAETGVVEGGMQNLTVTTLEVTLFIKQVDNNLVFATLSKRLKGSGSTLAQSIGSALGQLQPAAPEYEAFVTTGKQKILAYYKSECGRIIQQAEAGARMNKYEQALATLLSVPEETGSCYTAAQEKAVALYKAYANQQCAEIMLKAKARLALNKYEEGLTLLASVDPASKCYAEAKAMATKTETEVDAVRRTAFNASLSLEKQRINAVRDIAKAYYSNQPTTIQYNILVR